jgi:hypothetical protein
MKSSYTPPLYVWVVSAVLTMAFIGWCYWYPAPYSFRNKQAQWNSFQGCADNLEANWPFHEAQYKVLIWGSSLSCQGINHSPYFQEALADACDREVIVQKLYMLNIFSSELPHLERLFTLTAAIKPDLLLIEDHLIIYQVPAGKISGIQQKFIDKTQSLFASQKTKRGRLKKQPFFDSYNDRLLHSLQGDTTNLQPANQLISTFENQSLLRQQLSKYGLDSIPIIAINLPRPYLIESQYLHTTSLRQIETLVKDYQSHGYDFTYWKYPQPMPFTHYSDFAHMNLQGRNRYSEWLAQMLKDYLKKKCTYSNS